MPILEVQHLYKNFGSTKVLKDISFTLERGKALAIIGSSGSGKTTLLRCLNFLETPNEGKIIVNGETLLDAADHTAKSDAQIRKNRLHFGMVFQSFNLFPQYTALENVMLAPLLQAKERPDYKQKKHEIHEQIEHRAIELLEMMSLEGRMSHYPHQLSGGQQQRVVKDLSCLLHIDPSYGSLSQFMKQVVGLSQTGRGILPIRQEAVLPDFG